MLGMQKPANSSFLSDTTNTNVMTNTTITKEKKTVTLTLEAYNFLVSQGRKKDTFSQIVLSFRDRLK
jgi:hypothetical protein